MFGSITNFNRYRLAMQSGMKTEVTLLTLAASSTQVPTTFHSSNMI